MKRFILTALFCLAPFVSALAIGPGHSGSWFWIEQSGHGFSIEIGEQGDGTPLGVVYWYIYDSQGNPIFMLGTGVPVGDILDVVFESPVGMIFDEFDPDSVVREDGGTGRFVFTDENNATFQYTPSDFTIANWGHSPIAFMPLTKLFGIPVDGAAEDIAALELRVEVLETLVAQVQAELERVSPDADLTGTTYCIFGQGTWLSAGNGSAEVVANPFSTRLDFISATEFTSTPRYDPYSWIEIPNYIMGDEGDDLVPEAGTYTVIGNRLTITADEEDQILYLTPDGQALIGGFFERSVDVGVDWWESGMIVGIQAASCD